MGIELTPGQLAQTLREMQDLDTKIFGLEREIVNLSDKLHLGELAVELGEVRAAQGSSESELEGLHHKQHKLDGELDLLVQKMKKEEEKLFSGTIMNPKELAAIQAEIFALRKKRDEMETEDLEEMEEIDRLTSEVAESAQRTSEIERKEREAKEAYEEELTDLKVEVASLERQRDGLKDQLPADVVENYEKLLDTKAGLAVVPIIGGRSCGGCRIEFSRSQVDQYQHGEGVFRCEYCRRILVK
ncbi:MAG: zinc ribbon domain-containing protein [Candidatus Geothermincolia bacterium]